MTTREETASSAKVRVLIAKPGLDGHDRGAKVVARALSNVGMEVVYTGLRWTPRQIVTAAMQEDVHLIGLSILSGAHLSLTRKVLELMEAAGLRREVCLVVGGTIPDRDVAKLLEMGAAAVFPMGARLEEVVRGCQRLGGEALAVRGEASRKGF